MIYLDNAATTWPKPRSVLQAMGKAVTRFGANPGRSGHGMSIRAAEEIYRCRVSAAEMFHCGCPECVIFTPNCTCSVNMVLKGLLKKGDHVVCSDLEHNAVMRPLEALREQGITYTQAAVTEGDNDATVDAFRKALRSSTALVICNHASNVTGVRLPVERIAALSRFYQIPFALDCAQSAGVLPIDMEESGIDFLCAAGHKGLYGPMGTGLLLCKKGISLKTIVEGGTGTGSADYRQPEELPERFESGTQNLPGICGLREGLRFVQQRGIDTIRRHEMRLMQTAYDGLSRLPAVHLYSRRPAEGVHVPVLSFNVEDQDSETVGKLLWQRGIAVRAGLHCAPSAHRKIGTTEQGTVRICPSAFTTEGEIRKFVQIVSEVTKMLQNRF